MRRRALDILHTARDQSAMITGIAATPLLSDDDRRELRPIVCAFAVQQASFLHSRWWWGYHALRLGTALVAVTVPLAALFVWLPASGTRWAAVAGYLVLGGVVALGHGVQQARNVRPVVFAAGCAAVVLAVGILAGLTASSRYHWLWRGVGLSLVAAGALLALAEARLYGLLTVRAMVFRPLARRRAGALLPAQFAAVQLRTRPSSPTRLAPPTSIEVHKGPLRQPNRRRPRACLYRPNWATVRLRQSPCKGLSLITDRARGVPVGG